MLQEGSSEAGRRLHTPTKRLAIVAQAGKVQILMELRVTVFSVAGDAAVEDGANDTLGSADSQDVMKHTVVIQEGYVAHPKMIRIYA